MSQKISAVIITKNEEHNIERCVNSLKLVVDEIIIMDSNSTDNTVNIAERSGAKVYLTEWLGYAATKNAGHDHASHDYILSLDADEELSPELISEILSIKKNGLSGTYSMNRKTNYCGSWILHSGWYPDSKIRLFDKTKIKWVGEFVHESLEIPEDIQNTSIKQDILHYSYKDEFDHKQRADKYSALTAKKFFSEGKSASVLKPFLSLISRFFKMYILKMGLLDGKAGFRIAFISAISNRFKYQELRRLHKKSNISRIVKHICISRTDSLGDVMLTLPLAGYLKREFPMATITFLGKNYTQALVNSCSHIDHFLSYDELSKLTEKDQISKIQSLNIDTVIHVLPSKKIATLFKNCHTPIRLGTSRRVYNLTRCNRFVSFTRRKSNLHESQLNILMTRGLHCNAETMLNEITELYGFSSDSSYNTDTPYFNGRPRIIIHPKSQGSAPEWSLSNFQKLAISLENDGYQVFVTGTHGEGELIKKEFTFSSNIMDVTGKFNLNEFIWFIHQCDGLVAASTGPLHIAAALNICTTGLYTTEKPMHAGRWQPVGQNTAVISALTKENQLVIQPTEVKNTILNLISSSKQK